MLPLEQRLERFKELGVDPDKLLLEHHERTQIEASKEASG
jgi:hypothetical protein